MYRKAGAFGQDAVGAVLRFVIKPAPPVRARLGLSCRRKKKKKKKRRKLWLALSLSSIWIFCFFSREDAGGGARLLPHCLF
jgi:hypothetical protein